MPAIGKFRPALRYGYLCRRSHSVTPRATQAGITQCRGEKRYAYCPADRRSRPSKPIGCRSSFQLTPKPNRVSSPHRGSTTPKRRSLMSKSFPLPTKPEGVIPSLLERFNSGKIEAMMALYAPEAVFITKDGRTITDRTEIATQFQHDMSLGLPLKANVRHVFVGDDTAQIVVDWSIDGKGPDGEPVHLAGSASDIVRRGADGFWRYIIDNNQGTAVRQPA